MEWLLELLWVLGYFIIEPTIALFKWVVDFLEPFYKPLPDVFELDDLEEESEDRNL